MTSCIHDMSQKSQKIIKRTCTCRWTCTQDLRGMKDNDGLIVGILSHMHTYCMTNVTLRRSVQVLKSDPARFCRLRTITSITGMLSAQFERSFSAELTRWSIALPPAGRQQRRRRRRQRWPEYDIYSSSRSDHWDHQRIGRGGSAGSEEGL